jgi:hypothetical protein
VSWLDATGSSAIFMAVIHGHIPVAKCLIKEGGTHIDARIPGCGRKDTPLSLAAMHLHRKDYSLIHWLIKEGALIPPDIWGLFAYIRVELADNTELSSLLKVLTLLRMSPEQDCCLPVFVAKLSPQHAKLCTWGRQLRVQLPAYLEQQRYSVGTHLPAVLESMVTAYALPTSEDLWSDGLQWL